MVTSENRSNKFRCRQKYIIVTYSQIPTQWDIPGLIRLFHDMRAKIRVGLEYHEDGNPHVHVFAINDDRFNFRNSNALDHDGVHPNIKAVVRTPHIAWKYVAKEGNLLHDDIPNEPTYRSNRKRKTENENVYESILEGISYEDVLNRCKARKPNDFAKCFGNIQACARFLHPSDERYDYVNPEGFQAYAKNYPAIEQWQKQFLPDQLCDNADTGSVSSRTPSLISGTSTDVDASITSYDAQSIESDPIITTIDGLRYDSPPRPEKKTNTMKPRAPCLILWGKSRLGKSIFSRSLGRHCYFKPAFCMDELDEDADYAVFDDISGGMAKFDYKNWLGGQSAFSVTDKYRKRRTIQWGKPCIYLCNQNPFESEHPNVDLDWLSRNSVLVEITDDVPLAVDSAYSGRALCSQTEQ